MDRDCHLKATAAVEERSRERTSDVTNMIDETKGSPLFDVSVGKIGGDAERSNFSDDVQTVSKASKLGGKRGPKRTEVT